MDHTNSAKMNYDHVITHLPIYKAALSDDWDSVRLIFEKQPELMTKPINYLGETPLMIAVGTNNSHRFVKQLLERIVVVGFADQLFLTSKDGDNPLHRAAKIGNTTDATILVHQNRGMTQVPNKRGYTPLTLAAWHQNNGTLRYLLKETTELLEEGSSLYSGVAGGNLITLTILAGFLDIALDIIARYPDIVLEYDGTFLEDEETVLEDDRTSRTALEALATKPELFASRGTLAFWSQFIYLLIPMNERSQEAMEVNLFSKVFNKVSTGFWSVFRYIAPSIKKIHDLKVIHCQSKLLTRRICTIVIKKADHDITWKILGSATAAAVQYGTPEVIEECISTYPDIIWYKGKGFDLSLEAIAQRQEQVYNILFQSSVHKVTQATLVDKDEKENSLHKAAKLAPPYRLNVVTGAALQMQRELQWYKEVENFVDPLYKTALNKNKKTPKMIFIEEHKDLLSDAQQWMTDVSASSTVVAALIITMAFAGAFTLPGGNQDDGKPLFLDDGIFMLFIVSDAIALFSSTTSVLMFLGILTARFAEDDFLNNLPKRMTIGLVSLFVSLAATMIAFSATLALVLRDKVTWIAVPLVIMSCIPMSLFGWLQFPLLIELIYSTYGQSIFIPKKDRWIS